MTKINQQKGRPYNFGKNMNNHYLNNNSSENTNQTYLMTNPSLNNMQINSSISLNIQQGTRYFIIKSVDEDNIHKVKIFFEFFI